VLWVTAPVLWGEYGELNTGPTISFIPLQWDRLVQHTSHLGPAYDYPLFPAPALTSGVVVVGGEAVCSSCFSFRRSLERTRWYRGCAGSILEHIVSWGTLYPGMHFSL
jgi:hypothetical protein